MEPIITINGYPIGWEWLDKVPLEDFNWLIEIFSTMTDNTDTYDFVGYTDSETLPGHQKICSVDKISLANFLNEDQGYESGISRNTKNYEITNSTIVTIWLLILNEEAYLTKKFIYRMNLIVILLVYAFIQVYLIE